MKNMSEKLLSHPGITFIGFSIIKYTMEKFTIFVCIFLKDTYLCFIEY